MKKILATLVVGLSFWTGTAFARNLDVPAKNALAIETTTGKILYEKNANKTVGIASVTKLLTTYMVYQEISKGNLNWDTKVAISDYPYLLTTSGVANVPLEAREYTVKELLTASLIASANSPMIALAEHIAGSEQEFVNRMRNQLEDWGIKDYQIVNATGLNNEFLGDNIYPGTAKNAENRLSARSVALIAQKLILDYPDVLKMTGKATGKFAGMTLNSYNYLLPKQIYQRDGVDGLMTGFSEISGQAIVVSSTENNMSIISVVLGAENSDDIDYAGYIATNRILDYINLNYEMTTVLAKGKSFKTSTVKVADGKKDNMIAVAKEDLKAVQRKHSKTKNNLDFESSQKSFSAPITAGQEVGRAYFKDQNLIGSGYLTDTPSVEMVAQEDVNRSIFLKVWWNHFVNYVNEKL